jgi:hypothetical protein
MRALHDWLSNCENDASPASTNQSTSELPFQRWFKFKEAFSPKLIVACAATLSKPPRTCFDPCGGSGTTALTAQFLGIQPTTIEVNPFLADLIEAKLTSCNPSELRRDYLEVLRTSRDLNLCGRTLLPDAPRTLIEPGDRNRWVYPREVASRILALKQRIAEIPTPSHRIILSVSLGATIVAVSNVIVNGKGRKYRNGWKKRQKSAADVDIAFSQSFADVFSDICRFGTRKSRGFTLIRGDCRTAIDLADKVDLIILSPPYPNSFDYTDIYNLELWMLGYLTSRGDNSKLRQDTLRSHVQIHREFCTDTSTSETLAIAYQQLGFVRDALWNRHIPEMICSYFADMSLILTKLKAKLRKGGKAFLAVGNSKYGGVTVDTAAILMEIAVAIGFNKVSGQPIRSMRASAQQGGRFELRETLLTMS